MIYHFQIIPFEGVETLDIRNQLADCLEKFGYEWMESTGGQAAFKSNGDFATFDSICELVRLKGLTVTTQECADPGLGLF